MLAFLWSAGQSPRTRSRFSKENDFVSAFARTAFVGAAFVQAALLTPADAIAQELLPTNKAQDFGVTAREVFRDRCIECHGQEVQEGGLRLDHREGLIVGGESGKAVDFARSQDSLLLARIMARDETRMPPTGMPLNDAQIGAIRQWIDADGTWESESLKDPRLDHWAWQSLQGPQVPSNLASSQQDGNPIDRFLSVAMSAHGIEPLGRASREILIRRLSFDVLGIPPTPADSDQFVEDRSPDAWERLVDRTLGSPRYGERWARHWLDIAHYADTHGFNNDSSRTMWRWRDWVIDAFNANLPYDRFITEQRLNYLWIC
jgi:mono/diheme cytochrome c family protein